VWTLDERAGPVTRELGRQVAAATAGKVALRAECGFRAPVRGQRVRVLDQPVGFGVAGRAAHAFEIRSHRTAGDPELGEGPQHQVGIAELTRAVLDGPAV